MLFIRKADGTRRGEWREGVVREFRMDMYTLLYLKWITTRTHCTFLFFPDNYDGITGKGGKAVEKHSLRLSIAS